ncbi:SDR family NAD(P)-dependent oxidoreductase, partial [Kocuria arenosa]
MVGRVQDKRILITGAGSGMGRTIALKLADEGAKVVLFDLNVDAAQIVADDIETKGGRAIAVGGNVTQRGDVADAVQKSVDAFGGLD